MITGYCQEFKEGIVYNVFGNVKDLKLETRNNYLKKHIKFQKNGKCKVSATLFDENGYPLGYSLYYGNSGVEQILKYDSLNRIDSIIDKTSYGGGTKQIICHEYSSEETNVSQIAKSIFIFNSKDVNKKSICEYSNYVYDENGNWILRDVVQTFYLGGGEVSKVENYSEKRKIKYY